MTQETLSDSFDPRPETIWTELLPDYQKFPTMPIGIRGILREIRKHPKLTPMFKKKWIIAIASIFEEENIKDIIYEKPLDFYMLDSKIKDARKSLIEVMNSANENDLKNYHIESQNEIILVEFKRYLERENRIINSGN
ncbi:hypothetical protein [Methanosarcina barkeri]|uniref:Uncharacterized protein n=1 Tax=Methanosarcina barkeri CM1 TaxID=796385 RepID=A0A0G3CM37_METBA|nr:hypothetical protein [Methanosarcina barkeri]AKJ40147.1 hypothetical protein MCM1_3160 [Methanosarcina barkeri CM1]